MFDVNPKPVNGYLGSLWCREELFLRNQIGQGIKVSAICPQAVRTALVSDDGGVAGIDGIIEPEQVADAVMEPWFLEKLLDKHEQTK